MSRVLLRHIERPHNFLFGFAPAYCGRRKPTFHGMSVRTKEDQERRMRSDTFFAVRPKQVTCSKCLRLWKADKARRRKR